MIEIHGSREASRFCEKFQPFCKHKIDTTPLGKVLVRVQKLFAVTKTTPLYSAGTEIPSNEVLIYWMEPGELSLLWPKYYVGYILDWPVSMERYSVYSRSLDPALATAVQLNSADGPALVYQDDPTRQHAQLSNTYQFVSTVSTGTPVGRSLIRYINGDGIWFERV